VREIFSLYFVKFQTLANAHEIERCGLLAGFLMKGKQASRKFFSKSY